MHHRGHSFFFFFVSDKPRRGLQIMDTRMGFPSPCLNVVLDSISLFPDIFGTVLPQWENLLFSYMGQTNPTRNKALGNSPQNGLSGTVHCWHCLIMLLFMTSKRIPLKYLPLCHPSNKSMLKSIVFKVQEK